MMRAYVSATTYMHINVSVKKKLYHIFNSQKKICFEIEVK